MGGRSVFRCVALVSGLLVIVAACGGGDDPAETDTAITDPSTDAVDDPITDTTPVGDQSETDLSSPDPEAGSAGPPPTLEADPGQSWVEADGERFVYEASGSLYYTCVIDDQVVQVNYQTADGHDLSIRGFRQDGIWLGMLTFQPGGDGANVQYSTSLEEGMLGVAAARLSFEGPVNRIEDFDVASGSAIDARLAVNCESAGGDPTAVIDGVSYAFASSGAQSFECTIATDSILVIVNRLSSDNLQLAVDVSGGAGSRLGSALVITPDGNFSSTLVDDAPGLVIDGNHLTFDGTFTDPTGAEVPGTIDITCP